MFNFLNKFLKESFSWFVSLMLNKFIVLIQTQKSCSVSIMQRTTLVCTILLRSGQTGRINMLPPPLSVCFSLFINASGTFQFYWEPLGIEVVPFSQFSLPEIPARRVRSIYDTL